MKSYSVKCIAEVLKFSPNIRPIKVLCEAVEIDRAIPLLMGNSKFIPLLEKVSAEVMHVPQVVEYELSDPILVDDGVVVVGDYALSESLADSKIGKYGPLIINEETIFINGEVKEMDADGLLLKKRGQTNYGHWLVELLPKLHMSSDISSVVVSRPVKGYEFVSDMYTESITSLKADIRKHPVPRAPVRVENIKYVSGVSRLNGHFHPSISNMASKIRKNLRTTPSSLKKIFITRANSVGRQIANKSEVESLFLKHGFDIVDPGLLSFKEQVALFSNASHVYGIKGAGMCNAMFAGIEAKVGYISPEYMNGRFFLDFESALGRKSFNVLFCDSISEGAPKIKDDFIVNINLLNSFIEKIG